MTFCEFKPPKKTPGCRISPSARPKSYAQTHLQIMHAAGPPSPTPGRHRSPSSTETDVRGLYSGTAHTVAIQTDTRSTMTVVP